MPVGPGLERRCATGCSLGALGHFAAGGLGSLNTWTHQSGTGIALHPLRGINNHG